MASKTISQKISLEGAKELEQALESIGKMGEKVFSTMAGAVNRATTAISQFNQNVHGVANSGTAVTNTFSGAANAAGSLEIILVRTVMVMGVFARVATVAAAAATLIAGAAAAAAKSAAEFASETGKAADKSKLNLAAYQGMKFALQELGAAPNEAKTALEKFGETASEVGEKARKALTELGVRFAPTKDGAESATAALARMSSTIAGGKPRVDALSAALAKVVDALNKSAAAGQDGTMQMAAVADVFKSISDPAIRAALATALFGKEVGTQLLPKLEQGGEGLRKFAQDHKDFATTVTKEDREAADEFNKQMNRFEKITEKARTRLGAKFLPTLTDLVAETVKLGIELEKTFERKPGESNFDWLKRSAETVFSALKKFGSDAWSSIEDAAKSSWNSIDNAVSQQNASTFNTVKQAAMTAWDAVVARVSEGLGPAWTATTQAGSSVWSTIRTAATTAWDAVTSTVSQGLNTQWTTITQAGSSVWSNIQTAATIAWNAIVNRVSQGELNSAWTTVSQAGSTAWDAIKSAASTAINAIISVVSNLPGQISGIVSSLAGILVAPFEGAASAIMGILESIIAKIRSVSSALSGMNSQAGSSGASGSWATGGYTGNISPLRVAGVVHGGEYVQPARVVSRPGVYHFLELLRRTGGDLDEVIRRFRGFSAGGFVNSLNSLAMPRFAGGGMVPQLAASGMSDRDLGTLTLRTDTGQMVGRVFADRETADSLTRYATLQAIRSGGRKPSRYG